MDKTTTFQWRRELPVYDEEAELIGYLSLLGRCVEMALRARRTMLAELLAAREYPAEALERAAHASRRCVRAFDDALTRVQRGRAPAAAATCAAELRAWLTAHIDACDHLVRAAAAQDRDDFQRAMRCIAGSSLHAQGFNQARERLLRRVIEAGASPN